MESRAYNPRDVLTNDSLRIHKELELEARFYSQLIEAMTYAGCDPDIASYKVSKLWAGEREANNKNAYRLTAEKFVGEMIARGFYV